MVASGAERRLSIVQLHNRQLGRGGADVVADRERALLTGAGHRVERYEVDNATIESIGRGRAAAKAIWNRAASRDVAELIAAHAPDVVHVHTPYPLLSPAPLRAAARRAVPVVATMHGYRLVCVNGLFVRGGEVCELCVGSRTRWNAVRYRCYHDSALGSAALATSLVAHRALGTFDAVRAYLCLTDFARELFRRDGFPEDRLRVHPNFCPDPGAGPERRAESVTFVGRLTEQKGVPTVLAAWDLLDEPPALHIVGDGPLRPDVEAAAARNPAVTAHGWLPQPDAQQLVARSRYSLLASEWYEAGDPLVVIEAMATGTPVLAPDLGSVADTIADRGVGIRFRPGDAASLADAVRQAFDPATDAAAMGRRARATYLERHTPEQALARIEAVYRDVSTTS